MSGPSAPPGPAGPARLSGPQRAAALLMLLGEQHGAAIWGELDDGEIRTVCTAMAELGPIRGEVVDGLLQGFASELSSSATLMGSADAAEQLLAKMFPAERVASVMADVRGAAGRQVWRRMAHVPAEALARALREEHPQTVAVILSRIGPEQGGRVLSLLPHGLAGEVVNRTLRLGSVRPEALEQIEDMLHRQFLAGGPQAAEPDRFEQMADRFNAFDRPTETRFMATLEEQDRDAAARIREKMFTFDDLLKLDAAGAQTLLRHVDKEALARALKGASEPARVFFAANMSSRAAKNLQDDMDAMGPIRMKDVDEAQGRLVATAKALAERGELRLNKGRADEDVVG